MLRNWQVAGCCIFFCCLVTKGQEAKDFATHVRPVLQANCTACHNPANAKSRNNFLKGEDSSDVESRRGLWRNVATQLRNRTMPPGGVSKISEADRMQVANWIDARLRSTGCTAGDYAGFVPARRLNRREYKNTVRDLFGVDLSAAELFPADEAGGAGFDTNGETLYLPPMMLERYMEAAQVLLDRVIITAPMNKVTLSHELEPRVAAPTGIRPTRVLQPGEKVSLSVSVFAEGSYGLRVSVERPKLTPFDVQMEVDGVPAGKMSFPRDSGGGATARTVNATWTRGTHNVTLINGSEKIDFYSLTVEQRLNPAPAEKRALHYRLFGQEAGEAPVNPRLAARRLLARFLPKAYRAPVDAATIDRFLALYDRSATRAEPFEEGIKLALKGVLVSPRFLFRVEESNSKPGIQPLGQYEMASRLSYFLWATMPDEELLSLAARGQLQDPKVLAAQVERMLDDPRSRAFANAFMGQWLGTQDIGGRVVPLLTELQHFYTPEVAADLREQPELMFHYMLQENRSVLDLLTGRFTFLTERLARFYEVEGQVNGVQGSGFHLTEWPDNKRAGVLGLASVLAMSSHYRQGSPVLRGAWVLETLLGTPVPPPPPDVPTLETPKKLETAPTMRQMLAKHRAQESCAACHNLMDPIGLGLENFDWMGRWRDKELNGEVVDASGMLPSGEKFNGPVELRQVLLNRKEEFLRQFTGKVMGYALGRGLQDGDQCTVQRLMDGLAKDGYHLRTLVRDLVLSTPFRNSQADAIISEAGPAPKKAPKRLLGEK